MTVQSMRATFVVALGTTLATSPRATASVLTTTADFQAQNQSMWGPGAATADSFSQSLLSASSNGKFTLGGLAKIWLFACSKFGAELTAATSGSFGLGLNGSLTNASANASIPAAITLSVPDQVSGNSFTLCSPYVALRGATLSTFSPGGMIGLGLNIAAKTPVGAEGCSERASL